MYEHFQPYNGGEKLDKQNIDNDFLCMKRLYVGFRSDTLYKIFHLVSFDFCVFVIMSEFLYVFIQTYEVTFSQRPTKDGSQPIYCDFYFTKFLI